jgi:two-component system cell cycle response regulator
MKILYVEDNLGDARLLQEVLLELAPLRFDVTHVTSVAAALDALKTTRFDVGLLDLGLPDAQGLEVVRRIHPATPETPLIVLTGLKDDQVAVRSLHEGAQDYLVKTELERNLLWRAMRYAMGRQRVQLDLRNRALLDDLTGLNNREGFLTLAAHHVSVALRTDAQFLVGFVDLDHMKQINDTFGHQEGNRALVETAAILKDAFRQSDILGRFGGDEFAVLVTDASDTSIPVLTLRLEDKVAARNARRERPYELSLSIGLVAGGSADSSDLEHLLNRADELMYQRKRQRKALASR